jgi:hypothetical protein
MQAVRDTMVWTKSQGWVDAVVGDKLTSNVLQYRCHIDLIYAKVQEGETKNL